LYENKKKLNLLPHLNCLVSKPKTGKLQPWPYSFIRVCLGRYCNLQQQSSSMSNTLLACSVNGATTALASFRFKTKVAIELCFRPLVFKKQLHPSY